MFPHFVRGDQKRMESQREGDEEDQEDNDKLEEGLEYVEEHDDVDPKKG